MAERFTAPNGDLIHAEIRIGDSVVMLTDDADDGAPAKSPESLGGVFQCDHGDLLADVDAAWQGAVVVGAAVVYPLADQFYGERAGRLRDPQQLMLSQRIETVPPTR